MIALIKQAVAFIATLIATGNRSNEALAEANDTIAAQKKTIDELKAQHEADEIDDKTLEEAAANAAKAEQETQAKYAALQAEITAINEAGNELALAINAHPETPIVNSVFAETANAGTLNAVPNAFPEAAVNTKAAEPASETVPTEEVKPAEAAA